MLKQVAIGLGVVVIGFLGFVAMQPDTFHVERARTIPLPAAVVFDQVDDMKSFTSWEPWSEMDPAIELTFSGPPSGVGNAYAWKGNENVGSGEMTITSVEAPSKVVYALNFLEPFPSTATTQITLTSEGEGTRVVWAMDGQNEFMGKLVSLFMDMDAMVGADFEKGLGKLEGVAKAAHEKAEQERIAAEAAAAEAAAAAAAALVEGAAEAAAPTP